MDLRRSVVACMLVVGAAAGSVALPAGSRPAGATDSSTAVTLTWVGTTAGDWSTAANWSPQDVPANGDSLAFPVAGPTAVGTDNDLTGLTLASISFSPRPSGVNGCDGAASLTGNAVTVAGAITGSPWCYNAPTDPLGIPVVLTAGDHDVSGINFEYAVSGPGGVKFSNTDVLSSDSPDTYSGGTVISPSTFLTLSPPASGIVALPASTDPIVMPASSTLLDLSGGAIAGPDSLVVDKGAAFVVDTSSASQPFTTLESDGSIYLAGPLAVGNLILGPDDNLYPFGTSDLGTAYGTPEFVTTGAVDLDGTLSMSDAENGQYGAALPGAFLLIDRLDSAKPAVGRFTGLAEGSTVPTYTDDTPAAYTIGYQAGLGGDVGLTSPENGLLVSISSIAAGEGTVTSSPAGIDCPGTCSATFQPDTPVKLQEVAAAGSVVSSTVPLGSSGCSPAQSGTYASVDCTLTVDGGTFAGVSFSGVNAILSVPTASADPTDERLVTTSISGCNSAGVSSYQFFLDGTSLGPRREGCDVVENLAVGKYSVKMVASDSDATRTASDTEDIKVSSLASFSWQVEPVPYGSTTTTTTAKFDACQSAGVASFSWFIKGPDIRKTTTNCKYSVTLPTGASLDVTLTVTDSQGHATRTSAEVPVPRILLEPTTACSNFSVGVNSCWRRGLDWFGDAFGVSGNNMRAPDYAVLEASASAFGLGSGMLNVAITCDGNIYAGAGFGIGTPGQLPVSAVLAFGYVGDPDTVAPSMADIDSFVSGSTESLSISGFGVGENTINSPDASGPTIGTEYYFGVTSPGLTISTSYDFGFPGNKTPSQSATCANGATSSPIWQQLMNFQPGSPGADESFDPTTGESPTAGQGATIYVVAPAGTFEPGSSVEVGIHSSHLIEKATAATDSGKVGVAVRLPKTLALGVHRLLLQGINAKGQIVRVYAVPLVVTSGLSGDGYWLASSKGVVEGEGKARSHGDLSGPAPSRSVVGIAATADAGGYWLATAAGVVHAFGDARLYSSKQKVSGDIVAIVSTPDGKGYWLVNSKGTVYSFGDAVLYKAATTKTVSGLIVGMASTPSGAGYWLLSSTGRVYSFGDASSYRSRGGTAGGQVGIASTPDGRGYWIVSPKGVVHPYGDARTHPAASKKTLTGTVVAITPTPDGKGYWLVNSSGRVFPFGDAPSFSSKEKLPRGQSVVAMADM
jgi:hypothetical protein